MPTVTNAEPWVSAVRASHDRLSAIVAGLDADGLRAQSYDKDWTIADVLSHLGSGAEIFSLSLEAGVTGGEPPTMADFQPIWDSWNARTPEEQAELSVAVNEALVSRIESLTPAERVAFSITMFGRMTLDLAGFLGMRLSEHAVHTWDVAVAVDPQARLGPEAVGLLAVQLPMMIGFMGKKQDEPLVVAVSTSDPAVTFTLDTGGVALTPGSTGAAASLALPAEAFVRLVYGRLGDDADVTSADGVTVPELQAIFPGF
ncbi:MAG: maleylpyruvate isomerase family mycothiol-dependent enzyme [Trebonia sp.]|jgi:uncharacterized protein (TIGR03083 family)